MPDPSATDAPQPLFLTTRWSIVLGARDRASSSGMLALESLCLAYWYPLYVFVRRQGHGAHDAQDLTQAFFARLLEKDYLQSVEPEKGRFRTFLIVAMKRFLLNEWDKLRTQKRGGNVLHLPLDTGLAESRYLNESSETLPADQVFERRWALTLLEQAMARLRSDYVNSGREVEFEHLKTSLTAERGEVSYREIAAALQMTEGAARVALHRLRKRFREVFREEIANTVSTSAEVDDEVRYVVGILSRS
ncbi:MAG: sigma-70 family RNA polymerase sigma factor [Verrucomicrobiota bacterium]